MLPMTLAAALELVLNQYDIFDVDDLVAILRLSGRCHSSG